MATEFHIWDGSAFREMTEVHVFDGSQYRDCVSADIFDGSVYRRVFTGSYTPVVTLSGAVIEHNEGDDGWGWARAGVNFWSGLSTEGIVKYQIGGVWAQISESTDWIRPRIGADSTYDIRLTNVNWISGSSFDQAPAGYSEDTWLDMSENRYWAVIDMTGYQYPEVTFDVQIRKDGGATLDSAAYSLKAIYEP